MQQIGDPEALRKLEQDACGAIVADPSLGPGGVEHQICVAQQALYRRTRDRTLGMMVEDDPPLSVGQCHQPDPDAVTVRYRLFQVRLRGQFVDALSTGS